MKEEFNLYEKRKFGIGIDEYIYLERDVKEFIRLFKKELIEDKIIEDFMVSRKKVIETIDKLAGDKLK